MLYPQTSRLLTMKSASRLYWKNGQNRSLVRSNFLVFVLVKHENLQTLNWIHCLTLYAYYAYYQMSVSRTSTGPSLCSPLYDENPQIGYCLWVKCWLDNRILKSFGFIAYTSITESCAEIYKSVSFRRFAPDPSLRLPGTTPFGASVASLCAVVNLA